MEKKEEARFDLQLLELRNRLRREVDSAGEALREDVVKLGDISSVPTHPADEDLEGLDSEIAIAQNEELLLEHVEAALERIQARTYGVCQQCGRTIDAQRLQAVPYTSRCIDCARGQGDRSARRTAAQRTAAFPVSW
jgi:RNA polymerase-binding protein DksA